MISFKIFTFETDGAADRPALHLFLPRMINSKGNIMKSFQLNGWAVIAVTVAVLAFVAISRVDGTIQKQMAKADFSQQDGPTEKVIAPVSETPKQSVYSGARMQADGSTIVSKDNPLTTPGVWEVNHWKDSITGEDATSSCLYSNAQIELNRAGAKEDGNLNKFCLRVIGKTSDAYVKLPDQPLTDIYRLGTLYVRFDFRDGTSSIKKYAITRGQDYRLYAAFIVDADERADFINSVLKSEAIVMRTVTVYGETVTLKFNNGTNKPQTD
jgi:hypothetical protein